MFASFPFTSAFATATATAMQTQQQTHLDLALNSQGSVSSKLIRIAAQRANNVTSLRQEVCADAESCFLQTVHPLTLFTVNYVHGPMQKLDAFVDYYATDVWIESADARSRHLPLMAAGPWKLLLATLCYLYLIKVALPAAMRNRKPFELSWTIRGYNLMMILSNLFAFYHGCRLLNFGLATLGCEVIDHNNFAPDALELIHYGYLFLLSRVVEWLDTIFFCLRKKDSQVTKLHVFHHAFVPSFVWLYMKFHPGRTVAFFPFINTFVHIIMYTYYFLASFGAKVQPYLWWKKYLTRLQIAQFVLIIIQLASIYMTTSDTCRYPRAFFYIAVCGACLFLWLFYSYYVDTYTNKRQLKAAMRKSSDERTRQQQQQIIASQESLISKLRLQISDGKSKTREGASNSIQECIDDSIVGCDTQQSARLRKL